MNAGFSLDNYILYNEDFLSGVTKLDDNSVDLVIADPPYGLGKDYGNDSDKLSPADFICWTQQWLDLIIPKIKDSGSLYLFTTWRYSPEIFTYLKSKMTMINEIIWDRRVPSMGGGTRRFSSVHDTIGLFTKTNNYYFDLDAVRIPYDAKTKKARTRSIFKGKKWLELGYNPKDVWSIARLHKQHREREDHPTQKPLEIIDRMIKASSPEWGLVVDPFAGSGTSMESCYRNQRSCIGFEINSYYCKLINDRMARMVSQALI